MGLEPVGPLAVAVWGVVAALAAPLGVVPFLVDGGPRPAWVGGAYAAASGLMLGAGYLLLSERLAASPMTAVAGAVLGVLYTHATQRRGRRSEGRAEEGVDGAGGVLQNAVHSASEGVAIGVALGVHPPLGVFLAAALAVHNVGEGMALTELLRQRGKGLAAAAGLVLLAKSSQPLLAVASWAATRLPAVPLPLLLGFAAGSLVFLVLTELVPAAYRRAGETPTALLVSAGAGGVLLVESLLL